MVLKREVSYLNREMQIKGVTERRTEIFAPIGEEITKLWGDFHKRVFRN